MVQSNFFKSDTLPAEADPEIINALFEAPNEGEQTAEVYRREARAFYRSQPEKAASMLLDAAVANERDEASNRVILRDILLAVRLQPNKAWILSIARRMLLRMGAYGQCVSLIERELSQGGDISHSVTLCLEAGRLSRFQLGDKEKAYGYAKKALEFQAFNASALYDALSLALILGKEEEAADFASRLAQQSAMPKDRAMLHMLSGDLLIRLGRGNEGRRQYEHSLNADPNFLFACFALVLLDEREGHYKQASYGYERICDLLRDAKGLKSVFLYRAAELEQCCGDDPERGSRLLEAALRIDDADVEAYRLLAYFSESQNSPGKYVDSLDKVIHLTKSDRYAATLHLMKALCLEEKLSDLTASEKAYEQAMLRDGMLRLAFEKRKKILFKAGNAEAFSACCEERADIVGSEEREALNFGRACALDILGKSSEAVKCLTPLFSNAPEIFWFMMPLLEKERRYQDLANQIDYFLPFASDPGTASFLRVKLIEIVGSFLNKPSSALRYCTDKSAASRTDAMQRIALLRQLGKWEELCDSLSEEASDTSSESESRMWRLEQAYVLCYRLENADRACAVLEGMLREDPKDLLAIDLYRDIALKSGNPEGVIRANTLRDAVLSDNVQRTASALESGWCGEKLGDNDQALIFYAHCLGEDSDFVPYALWRSNAILRNSGKNKERLALLDSYIAAVSDDEKQEALREAVRVCSLYLGEEELAVEYACQALALCPDDKHMLFNLFLGAFRLGRSEIVEEKLAALVAEAKDSSTRLICAFALSRLGDEHRDMLYREAAQDKILGSSLAIEQLAFGRLGSEDDFSALLEHFASGEHDRSLVLESLREACSFRAVSDEDEATRLAAKAFRIESDDIRLLWMMEQLAYASEDWRALASILDKQAYHEMHPIARVRCMASAILPYIDADMEDKAKELAVECLKYEAHCFPALLALVHLAEEDGQWENLAMLADKLAQASESEHNRLSYGLWGAKIWEEKLHNSQRALSSLYLVLSHRPSCLPALLYAEQLLTAMKDPEQLSILFVRAINDMPKGKEQIALLRKHTVVLSERLGDYARASGECSKILEQLPEDIDALSMQSNLLCLQSRWSEAIVIFERIVDESTDGDLVRRALLEQARILFVKLHQNEKAKRILNQYVRECEGDAEALYLIFDIAYSESDWESAAKVLRALGQCEGEAERIYSALKFARVAGKANYPDVERKQYERTALMSVLNDRISFMKLVDDYKECGEIRRLVDVGRELLNENTDSKTLSKLKGTIAALMVADGKHAEALSFLSSIIQVGEDTDWAYLSRAKALQSAGKLDSAVSEYRRTLRLNLHFIEVYEPFIALLGELGDEISARALECVYRDLTGQSVDTSRCYRGQPGGFLDFNQFALELPFRESERYLRLLSPGIFELYPSAHAVENLSPNHPVVQRSRVLFGQMIDFKKFYRGKSKLMRRQCEVYRESSLSLAFSDALLSENDEGNIDFWSAFAMHHAVSGACVLENIGDVEAGDLMAALCRVNPDSARAVSLKKQLRRILSRSDRRPFKDGVPYQAPDWEAMRKAFDTRAACIGAVISASPGYAIRYFANDDLRRFLVSADYARLVRAYWI